MGSTSDHSLQQIALRLNCHVGSFPFTYLGIPIKPTRLHQNDWMPFISRLEKRLDSWKGPLLSRGGRLVLVNVVLTSMPLHLMSYFLIPKWVLKHIDQIRRSFFWKGQQNSHGSSCLINWEVCCRPKHLGGLGILNLKLFNISLVSKWWWKLMTDPSSPWAKLILHSYYRNSHHLQAINCTAPNTSAFWKGVIKTTVYFKLGVKFICGNGDNTRFWLDPWLSPYPLSSEYPSLFAKASDQSSSVASNSLRGIWSPTFRHLLPPEDISRLGCLLQSLPQLATSDANDKITWSLHRSGLFSVNSLYRHLASTPAPTFPLMIIWSFHIPLKVKINLWLAAQGRLLTSNILHQRNIAQLFSCLFCKNVPETADHIFLQCDFISPIWNDLRNYFRLPRLPSSLYTLLTTWRRRWISSRISKVWDGLVAALVWIIWKERNLRVFQSLENPVASLSQRALSQALFWSANL